MPDSKKKTGGSPRRRVWALIIMCLIAIGCVALAFPPQDKINQGLDIQGGLSVVLSAQSDGDEAVTADDMEKAKEIVEKRINALGTSEASVQIQGDNQLLVQIPGMSDSTQALATIGKTGVLEFARLDSFTDEDVKDDIDSGNITDTSTVETPEGDAPTGGLSSLIDYSKAKNITVESGTYDVLFTGDHITNVTVDKESDGSAYYAVNITLDSEATQIFADATTELYPDNGKIVILLDNEVNSAPAVQSAITGGQVQITGNYSLKEAQSLQTVLNSGSLPVSFTYEQAQTVGPTLGQGELQAGVLAMIIGLILVMLYLLFFYRGFGLITAANMVLFSATYLGVLAALSAFGVFSLSLAGIAGIILSIGMAADSAILTIEKFKQELKEGRTIKAAADNGVRHAIITSIDADVVSILSALALFIFATSTVKGFGLTLALGILCDIFVMVMFIGPATRLLSTKVFQHAPGVWGVSKALQLGDERYKRHNFMTKEEIAAEKAAEKEAEAEAKARKKEYAKEHKGEEKAKNKKAKEIRKATKKSEKERAKAKKQQQKEKLAAVKAAEKQNTADEKAARKAEKAAAKEEKKTVKEEARAEKLENVAEDAATDVEKTDKDLSIKPEAIEATAKKHTQAAHSEEEVDALIAGLDTFVPKERKLERVADESGMMTSGPSDTENYSVADDAPQKQVQAPGQKPPMNRAQRRQAEREARSKKNKA